MYRFPSLHLKNILKRLAPIHWTKIVSLKNILPRPMSLKINQTNTIIKKIYLYYFVESNYKRKNQDFFITYLFFTDFHSKEFGE